jgi:hypothetical protein
MGNSVPAAAIPRWPQVSVEYGADVGAAGASRHAGQVGIWKAEQRATRYAMNKGVVGLAALVVSQYGFCDSTSGFG